jgi:hypothetical protein
MAKKKQTSKKTPKASKPKKAAPRDEAPKQADDSQELVVFAFRLTRAERDLIHKAAGPAKASKFVRSLAVAAAAGDEAAVKATMESFRHTV